VSDILIIADSLTTFLRWLEDCPRNSEKDIFPALTKLEKSVVVRENRSEEIQGAMFYELPVVLAVSPPSLE
jgi:hypothetical protein